MRTYVVTYPPYLREKARALRVDKRLTIDELAERLAVSRTTVFVLREDWSRLGPPGRGAAW